MNEQLKSFIDGIGAFTEIWTITFNSFKKQGMNDTEAIKHTGAFMSSFMRTMLDHVQGEKNDD